MYYAKLTREELLFEEIGERSIDVSVARLRKKIEEDVKRPKYIRTVKNKGYIIYIYWKRFLSSLYKILLMFCCFLLLKLVLSAGFYLFKISVFTKKII